MPPQQFDPATHGELGSSSMTRQEGTAIFKGNAQLLVTIGVLQGA